MLYLLATPALALRPTAAHPAAVERMSASRLAVQPTMVATSPEEKTLLAASRRVTLAAQKFGPTQGKAAQKWVAESIEAGNLYEDFKTEALMEMQLTLFEECQLDDDSGKCKDLSDAIEELNAAVAVRKKKPKTDEFDFNIAMGSTPTQEAATKLRNAATLFGPEQKAAADAWIKQVIDGDTMSKATGLLEQQVALFGECVLSEDSTPSKCQQLDEALAELQQAIETCRVDRQEDCDTEVVASKLKEDKVPEVPAPKPSSGAKRRAVKNVLHMLTLNLFKTRLSPYQVACFLAAPEEVDPDLKGESRAVLVAQLKQDGVPDETIQNAVVNVLPFLPGQESKWGESLERPKK